MRRALAALILIAGCGVAQAQTGGAGITPTGTITPGDCMKWGATKFKASDAGAPCGSGTVTSVGLALPTNLFVVSGSPVVGAGTLTGTLTPQSANIIFAGPASGAAATPTFRSIVAADLPGLFSGFATPTVTVAITPSAGVLTTALRSDAGLAIDQSIAPTWTGQHIWAAGTIITSRPLTETQTWNAAGVVFSGHTTNITPTAYAAGSNWADYQYSGTSLARIQLVANGGSDGYAQFVLARSKAVASQSATIDFFAANFNFASTIAGFAISFKDSSQTRFYYDTTSNTGGAFIPADLPLGWGSVTNVAGQGSPDLWITRGGAAKLQLGLANAASPVAQTIQTQGSRVGTDTNTGGANLTVASGIGTGTGSPSGIILQTPTQTTSGKTTQVLATSMIITNGAASVGSATLSISPGSFGITRITTSATAPGALGGKLELICGATAGTARLVVYAGTSATPKTIIDSIGTGVSGC